MSLLVFHRGSFWSACWSECVQGQALQPVTCPATVPCLCLSCPPGKHATSCLHSHNSIKVSHPPPFPRSAAPVVRLVYFAKAGHICVKVIHILISVTSLSRSDVPLSRSVTPVQITYICQGQSHLCQGQSCLCQGQSYLDTKSFLS